MFGLLKHDPAAMSAPEQQNARLHYCGTCKTLGTRFGQLSRTTLNFDIVFLSELLSAVNNEDTGNWQKSLSSYHCFNMPGKNTALPASLEYAAALNVILAGLKIKDNVHDSKNPLWKGLNRLFRSPYKKAMWWMKQRNIPVHKMEEYVAELQRREKNGQTGAAAASFDYYARPTAALTAMAMANGTPQKDKQKQLYQTGYCFGKLIYLLDAYRDREKDARKKQFNPFFVLSEPCTDAAFERVLMNTKQNMETAIRSLNLTEVQTSYFISKLHLNFSIEMNRLNFANHVYHTCSHTAEKMTLKLRFRKGKTVFHHLKQSLQPNRNLWQQWKFRYLVPALAFIAVFLHPASAAAASEQQVANGNAGSASSWLWVLAAGVLGDKCCKDTKCKCCSEPCCGKK